MTHFEEMQILSSMEILVDTREQVTPKSTQRYNSFGVPYSRATLSYGDYTANYRLLDGNWLYDISKTIHPKCVVERKMNLDELASCFTHSRERFEREFEKARSQGCFIHLICEDGSFEKVWLPDFAEKFDSKVSEK